MRYPELFSLCSILPYQQKIKLFTYNRDFVFSGTCADILGGSAIDCDGDEIFENRFTVYGLYPHGSWMSLTVE